MAQVLVFLNKIASNEHHRGPRGCFGVKAGLWPVHELHAERNWRTNVLGWSFAFVWKPLGGQKKGITKAERLFTPSHCATCGEGEAVGAHTHHRFLGDSLGHWGPRTKHPRIVASQSGPESWLDDASKERRDLQEATPTGIGPTNWLRSSLTILARCAT